MERLRTLDPWLMDATLRENSVGSKMGLTVANKMEILREARSFGFERMVLGALNYSMPDELTVEDDFLIALRDQGVDRKGGFALVDPGSINAQGVFEPSISLERWALYEVPGAMLEVYLAHESLAGAFDAAGFENDVRASVDWALRHAPGAEVVINVVDGCDACANHPERFEQALRFFGTLPVVAVSLEEGRGTFFPFQVGAYCAKARAALPRGVKLLAHIHAGAGFEGASMMEALLNGADGAWGGLPKRAGVIGHASLGELLANLARVGNPFVRRHPLEELAPVCSRLALLIDGEPMPADVPMVGGNAYRIPLAFFRQREGRFMDLPASAIGARCGSRICPAATDAEAVLGRLREVAGESALWTDGLARRMIRLMRQDLRSGLRVVYDEPAELLKLARRADGGFEEGGIGG